MTSRSSRRKAAAKAGPVGFEGAQPVPVAMSQTRTVPSLEVLASRAPVRSKATELTSSVCPDSVASRAPSATRLTAMSCRSVVAINAPSGLKIMRCESPTGNRLISANVVVSRTTTTPGSTTAANVRPSGASAPSTA